MNKLYFLLGVTALVNGSFVIASRFLALPRLVELIVPVILTLIICVLAIMIFVKRKKSD